MSDSSERKVHLNGALVPSSRAVVSVWDAGFLHGASAFTTMLARNGRVFRLQQHLQRMLGTAAMLNLRTGATAESLSAAMAELLSANGLSDARCRITLTGGSVRGGEPTTLITAEPLTPTPSEWYDKGIPVVLAALRQLRGDPAYGHKTGCYLARMLARQEAAARGAEEALWLTEDEHLAEACFCNVFLVRDGRLATPPLDTPVLPGIVRQAVLELCGRLGIEADDHSPLSLRDLLDADEAFLTSSIAGVRPVVRVENRDIGDAKPGPITRRVLDAYRELVQRECDGAG